MPMRTPHRLALVVQVQARKLTRSPSAQFIHPPLTHLYELIVDTECLASSAALSALAAAKVATGGGSVAQRLQAALPSLLSKLHDLSFTSDSSEAQRSDSILVAAQCYQISWRLLALFPAPGAADSMQG